MSNMLSRRSSARIDEVFQLRAFKLLISRDSKNQFESKLQQLPSKDKLLESDLPECLKAAADTDSDAKDGYSYQDKLIAHMITLYDKPYIQSVLIAYIKSQPSRRLLDDTAERILCQVPEIGWKVYDQAKPTLMLEAVQSSALGVVTYLFQTLTPTHTEQTMVLKPVGSRQSPIAVTLNARLAKRYLDLEASLQQYPVLQMNDVVAALEANSGSLLQDPVKSKALGEFIEEKKLFKDPPNSQERQDLLVALRKRTILRLLISKHIELELQPDETFLENVIKNDEVALLNILLSNNPFPHLLRQHHLRRVVEIGSDAMWNMLVDVAPRPLADGEDAGILHLAIMKCKESVVRQVLKEHPKFAMSKDQNGKYPLGHLKPHLEAKAKESAEIRKHLLEALYACDTAISEVKTMFLESEVDVDSLTLNLSVFDGNKHSFQNFLSLIAEGDIETRRKKLNIRFEPIMSQFVSPNFNRLRPNAWHTASDGLVAQRSIELKKIFDWLSDVHQVKEIIAVKITDSLTHPHSEEQIEKLIGGYAVRKFDWKRLDLSIDTIKKAAPAITQLVLYSSGSWTGVRHWFGESGLRELETLQKVEIIVISDFVSGERADAIFKFVNDELAKFKHTTPKLKVVGARIESWTRNELSSGRHGQRVAEKLAQQLTGLENFLSWYRTACNRLVLESALPVTSTLKKVKVAVIDNGFDYLTLGSHVAEGESFVYDAQEESNWFLASDLHGTQMASLVTQLNPHCQLYLAKVGNATTDITAHRVSEALHWAIRKEVDIISISLAVFDDEEKRIPLQVSEAFQKKITVFASTADGARDEDVFYPAKCLEAIAIAGCDKQGRPLYSGDKAHADFYLRGTGFRSAGVKYLEGSNEISGSSVATAIAAGVASLMMVCAGMAGYSPNVGFPSFFRTTFENMTKPGKNAKEIQLNEFFFDDCKTYSDGVEAMKSIFADPPGSHKRKKASF